MRRLFFLGASIALACAPSTASIAPAKAPPPARKEGAILLATAGKHTSAFGVPGSPREVVRGRVRFHLENDGTATRLRSVTYEPTAVALTLPPWLGNGIALLSAGGLTLVDEGSSLRPLLRAPLTAPSVGAHELWARARNTTNPDWVRIDVSTGKATWSLAPIAAPLSPTWSAAGSGPLTGRAITAGPEFISQKVAFALVDMLGPITTRDGGDTWGPLPKDAIAAAFPLVSGPTRLVREPAGIMFADEQHLVPVSPTGQLGASIVLSKSRDNVPDVASIRLETALLQGVKLEGGNVLVVDGGRFAVVSIDPIRVLRVSRAPDLGHCELRPAPSPALALAVCTRNDESPASAGAQVVVGPVLDGPTGPHLVPERIFPSPTAYRFASDGALVLSAPCVGTEPVSNDVVHAPKVCVRAIDGKFHESVLGGIAGRVAIAPRSDGGVLLVRIAAGMMELTSVPPDATTTTIPSRLAIDAEAVPLHRELVSCSKANSGACFDEISPGKFVLWRKIEQALEPLSIELVQERLRIRRGQALPLAKDSTYSMFGDRALVASVVARFGKPSTIKGDAGSQLDLVKITTDAGTTWSKADWPDEAIPLDEGVECAALGCLVYGWSRFGYQRAVASVDEIVSLEGAPELPAQALPPEPSTSLVAHCKSLSKPSPFDPARVPLDGATDKLGKIAARFGPEPKVANGQTLQSIPLHGAVEGALFAWGPTAGSWGEVSRMFMRFSTDLDSLGTVHETAPAATSFTDRNAILRVASGARAYPLSAGRAFLSLCEYGHCGDFYRVMAGMPLERIDLAAVGAITSIGNARELGGVLLVVGKAIPKEKIVPLGNQMPEEQPFVALITTTGTITAALGRTAYDVVGTTDPVHGRFGMVVATKMPTWLGGTTNVLPIEANGLPSGTFEQLVTAPSEINKPTTVCSSTSSGWDRVEQNKGRSVRVEIDGLLATTIDSTATAIRMRLTASGACLDRFTQLGAQEAFQLDPTTSRATLLSLADDRKSATKTDLSCTLEWTASP